MYNLNKHRDTILQFVPGHKGIPGNELADLTANAGHVLDIEKIPVPKEDQNRAAMNILCKHWSVEWKSEIANSGKGKHLEKIKCNIGHWPWAQNSNRLLERVFARLRIGHVGLQAHKFRFHLTVEETCDCLEEEETVEHYLLECSIHLNDRSQMLDSLRSIKVAPTLRNLLGGGSFKEEVQYKILKIVAKFMLNTKQLNTL